jgi:hypothetical protein
VPGDQVGDAQTTGILHGSAAATRWSVVGIIADRGWGGLMPTRVAGLVGHSFSLHCQSNPGRLQRDAVRPRPVSHVVLRRR